MIQIIIQNNYILLKIITSIIVILTCFIIFYRTNKLYKLSEHKGLKIFSRAFLYFGIGFIFIYTAPIVQYLISKYSINLSQNAFYYLIGFGIYFFLALAGLSLVYSLVWKEFEKDKNLQKIIKKITLFKNKEPMLYLTSIIISMLSLYNGIIFFFLMLLILSYAMILSYNNYQKIKQTNTKNKFAQFYFIIIVLTFIGYLVNFLMGFINIVDIYVNLLTIGIFITILIGTQKLSNNN